MARDTNLPPMIRDLLYAGEHRLLDDDVGRALARIVACGVDDGFAAEDIQQRVKKHQIAQAFAGPFSTPHLSHGDLTLGRDQRGHPIRIPLQFLNAHSFTLGGSGSGKTIKSLWLTLQVAPLVDGVWLFDLRKCEFRKLRLLLAQRGIDLAVYQARDLRLNPLQVPPHVSPVDWASRVSEMLVQVFQLPPRATKLLHATVLKLYRAGGVIDGGENFPTLFDLRQAIANDREANAPARMAIIDSLEPTLQSLGDVLRQRQGWTSNALAKRHLIFEFAGVSEVDKNLLLNTLVWGEFCSRVSRGVSNVRMDLWICCDEAQRLVSSSNASGGITDLLGLVRGTGVGLDLSVQSADVAPSILSNTASKFVGRCGSAADYDSVGAAMGLNAEQRRWMALNLKPGLFVGQVGEGDWRRPFVFQVPLLNLPATHESRSQEQRAQQQPRAPRENPRASLFISMDESRGAQREPIASTNNSDLSEAEIRYLRAVINNPGQSSSAYPKIAKVGSNQANAIRRCMVARGYLREHRVNTGKRGRASIVLEPMESAHRVVREFGDTWEGGIR